jgi:hypothetical protein
MCVYVLNCIAQEQKMADIDFFDFVKQINVGVSKSYLNKDKTITISYFYCRIPLKYCKTGAGCLYALPKKEWGIWKVENITNLERKELFKNSTEKSDCAKKLLFTQRDTLFAHFDVYVFFVKQEDMMQEGSSMTDDGQLILDYHPKEDATIYTYKYENGIWIEIGEDNLHGWAGGARYFREVIVVDKILKERFAEIELK